uniref:3',5'-cyclic-GMP phosphodiesterase n=1 Tax=Leptobrachium leishanense TaxID=445787 RepID=A0A8C5QJC9_9ANUR
MAEENTEPAAPVVPAAVTVSEPETKEVETEEETKVQTKFDPLADLNEFARVETKVPMKVETKVEEENDVKNEEKEEQEEEDANPGESIDEENEPQEENEAPVAKHGMTPRKGPRFKQRQSKNFKSKPPTKGVIGFGEEIPGMDGLGTDITVICPWEAFSHLELHELAQFGII